MSVGVARFLATPAGRIGRVVVGVVLAGLSLWPLMASGLAAIAGYLLFMLGAEIAVGGALNVCVLCPLRGLPFSGRRLSGT